MRKNIIVYGRPQAGKSTLLESVVGRFSRKAGFITKEVREWRRRVGFEMISSTGRRGVVAHVKMRSPERASRFGVDVGVIDAVTNLTFMHGDLLYIDEIGEIQLASAKFAETALRFLDSPNICIATLTAMLDTPYIEAIRRRPDAIFIEITQDNRQAMMSFVPELIKKIEKARRYIQDRARWTLSDRAAELRSDHDVRHLIVRDGQWICTCPFYGKHLICSHTIAAEHVSSGA